MSNDTPPFANRFTSVEHMNRKVGQESKAVVSRGGTVASLHPLPPKLKEAEQRRRLKGGTLVLRQLRIASNLAKKTRHLSKVPFET